MNSISQSIVKIRATQRRSQGDKSVGYGTGCVIYSDKRTSLILTAGHIAAPAIEQGWETQAEVNRAWQFQIARPALESDGHGLLSFEAVCLATAWIFPDVGLLKTETDLVGETIPALPIANHTIAPTDRFKMELYGFRRGSESLSTWDMDFQEYDQEVPWPYVNFLPLGEHGCSGGPFVNENGEIAGIFSTDNRLTSAPRVMSRGPSSEIIRYMLHNWAVGKYEHNPYDPIDRRSNGTLSNPPIDDIPGEIREILRGLT